MLWRRDIVFTSYYDVKFADPQARSQSSGDDANDIYMQMDVLPTLKREANPLATLPALPAASKLSLPTLKREANPLATP